VENPIDLYYQATRYSEVTSEAVHCVAIDVVGPAQCCTEADDFLDLNHDAPASFKKAGDLRSRDLTVAAVLLDSLLPGGPPARRRSQETKKIAARGAKSRPREVRPSPSILTPGASTACASPGIAAVGKPLTKKINIRFINHASLLHGFTQVR
jgi:hypothetical protein